MILEKNDKSAIIELFADECIRGILSLTSRKEYSTIELSDELNISISVIYRRLKILEDSGLIQHVKTIVDLAGNEEKYYRCVIRNATVSFEDGKFSVSLKKQDFSDKVTLLWKRLAPKKSEKNEQHHR